MDEYLSSEAIILKSQDYKENDKIITFFGKNTGKMRALVKGAKKSNSKLRGATQSFSITDLTLTKGKSMPIVINGEVKKSFVGISDDYLAINYACILGEFVDKIMPEAESDTEVYDLLKVGIMAMSERNAWSGCMGAIFRLMEHMGYGAEYQSCIFCGTELKNESRIYCHEDGLACEACSKESGEHGYLLSRESVVAIRFLQELAVENMRQVYASTRAKAEIEQYIELQLSNILDYPLKSWEIYKKHEKKY